MLFTLSNCVLVGLESSPISPWLSTVLILSTPIFLSKTSSRMLKPAKQRRKICILGSSLKCLFEMLKTLEVKILSLGSESELLLTSRVL